jgi:hypothetical protein
MHADVIKEVQNEGLGVECIGGVTTWGGKLVNIP